MAMSAFRLRTVCVLALAEAPVAAAWPRLHQHPAGPDGGSAQAPRQMQFGLKAVF